MHKVYHTLFSHKASFSQGRYVHPLFPWLDIDLLLNAFEQCWRMYILIEAYTK